MTNRFPSDKQINELLDSFGIAWSGSNVEGLSFLGKGRAREAWEPFAGEVSVSWDRIGRVRKTPNGSEWLLVREYKTPWQCEVPVSGISCSADGAVEIAECSDLQLRVNIIEFLRINGVCCRLLLVFSFAESMEEKLSATGVWENGKTKNRVFRMYAR